MSADMDSPAIPDARTSLHVLVEETSRQLAICNACRYCEGLCAVYPALERRSVLGLGDVSQLANLCHDCRACFDACMYAPPHEYAINIPRSLAAVRLADYRRYAWPPHTPRRLTGWRGIALGAVTASVLVLLVSIATRGPGALVRQPERAGSAYDLIPYGVLLALLLVPALYAVTVLGLAGRAFWRSTSTSMPAHPAEATLPAVGRAVRQALTMRYLKGGQVGCYYPDKEQPSPWRRRLHFAVAFGFGLCLVSTTAAAVMQDFMSIEPPYRLLSVPVISGIVGGIGILVGCVGLLCLKASETAELGVADMTVKDYSLLGALAFLAMSGLAALLTRDTVAFGPVFLVHLAAVIVAFAAAPYSKFAHVIFRFLALVRDNVEQSADRAL